MSVQHAPAHGRGMPAHTGFRVTEWVLGVVGAISAFVGLFVLFGPDDQYVGLGGDASWRVGEVAPAWGAGLLIGGLAALAVALGLVVRDRHVAREPGGERESGWPDVAVHAVVFVLVNAFLWAQDLALGGGLTYAYWVTIPWGIGLAVHVLTEVRASRRIGS
jgi:2TM domain